MILNITFPDVLVWLERLFQFEPVPVITTTICIFIVVFIFKKLKQLKWRFKPYINGVLFVLAVVLGYAAYKDPEGATEQMEDIYATVKEKAEDFFYPNDPNWAD